MTTQTDKLTDERIQEIFDSISNDDPDVHLRFARAIEAVIKNSHPEIPNNSIDKPTAPRAVEAVVWARKGYMAGEAFDPLKIKPLSTFKLFSDDVPLTAIEIIKQLQILIAERDSARATIDRIAAPTKAPCKS